MPRKDKKAEFSELLEQLHDPLKLRLLIAGAMVLVGYFVIYVPLSGKIDTTTRKLDREEKRQTLANDVDLLRAQVAGFEARLPVDTDTNEWVQYVLGGVRRFPLKITALDSDKPRRIGPYEAVVMRIQLEGGYDNIDEFLHWLESNERLFRVDATKIEPSRKNRNRLVMQLTILGMKG